MKKTVQLVAVGLGIAAGSIFGAGSAFATPQGPAVVQDSSGWPDDLASGLNDGWMDTNGGAANDGSGWVQLGAMVAGSAWQAAQNHHDSDGGGGDFVYDPSHPPAMAGTVGLDTEGNSPITTVGGDSGLSVGGQATAPASTVGTVNIDTAPVDCNAGFYLVPPAGCP